MPLAENCPRYYFRKEEYTEGICRCLRDIGAELEKYYPYEPDDTNELPDNISYGEQ